MSNVPIDYFYYIPEHCIHLPKSSELFELNMPVRMDGEWVHYYVRVEGDENLDLWTLASSQVDFGATLTNFEDDFQYVLRSKNPYFLLQALISNQSLVLSSIYRYIDEFSLNPIIIAYEVGMWAISEASYRRLYKESYYKFKILSQFYGTDDPKEMYKVASKTTPYSWFRQCAREDFNNITLKTLG